MRLAQFTQNDLQFLAENGMAAPTAPAPPREEKRSDVLSNGDSGLGVEKLSKLLAKQQGWRALRDRRPDASAWNVVFEPIGAPYGSKYRCDGIEFDFDVVPRTGDVVCFYHSLDGQVRANFARVERVVSTGGFHAAKFVIGGHLRGIAAAGFNSHAHAITPKEISTGELVVVGVVKNPEIILLTSEEIAR